MRIGKPNIQQYGNQTRYEVQTDEGDLWFSVPSEFSCLVSNRDDAALVGLLIPAMIAGQDIVIEGNLSAKLHYSANGRLQSLIKCVLPHLKNIRITAPSLTDVIICPAGVATGFSGGIDSYCAIFDHLSNESPSFNLTHLLYNRVGAHGEGRKFDSYFEKISDAARPLNLPVIKMTSNLETFYPALPTFQQTHTLRNAAAALVLQGGIGRFLYASTYHYSDLKFTASNDIAFTDAAAAPLLSTETMDVVSVGSEYTRVQKTLRIADRAETHLSLDVCTAEDHDINCSRCFKCLRTMLTLDIAGKLDLFSHVFDIASYRSSRDWYISHVLSDHDDPFSREIVSYISEREFAIPARSKVHYFKRRLARLSGRKT